MFIPVHRHLILFAAVRKPITEVGDCSYFLLNTIKNAGMTCISGPHVVNVKDQGNEGLTGTATLAESHTSIHIWEKALPVPYVQFDLYSCKEFPVDIIVNQFKSMDPTVIRWSLFDRDGGDCELIEKRSITF